MRSIVFLPIGLIEEANENGWLRSLAYFVKCKSIYYNNTIYNFSLRKLAEKIKCSHGALAHHLAVLEKQGLVRRHAGNMTFLGLEKLQNICTGLSRTRKSINVRVDKDQLTILRGKIVQLNLNRQCYRLKRKGTIIPNREKFLMDSKGTCGHNVSLSNKGFGRLFGLSGSTGNIIKKRLVNAGQITEQRCIKIFYTGVDYLCFRTLLRNNRIPAYSKHFNGNILVDTSSVIEYVDSLRGTKYITERLGIRRN